MSRNAYVLSQYRDNPLQFLIALMSLAPYRPAIEGMPEALRILTGIVCYRCLPAHERSEVLGWIYPRLKAHSTPPDERRVLSYLYGMVGNIIANPYWFAWSLDDDELRAYHATNKNFSDAVELLGLDLDSSMSVVSLASGMVSVAQNGVRRAIVDLAKDKANITLARNAGGVAGLSSQALKKLGLAAAMVTVLAGVLHAQAAAGSAQARRELIARGLLSLEEI